MNLLLLGGTADGRHVANALHQKGVELIYSVAGLVRVPKVACPVISGGFSQYGGLKDFIEQQKIDAILDVTHPFALTMSSTAVDVAAELGIPCWRFHRPAWQQQEGDDWRLFSDWPELLSALADYQHLFVTAGQLSQSLMDQLTRAGRADEPRTLLYRTAAPPKAQLSQTVQWLKAIGPFDLASERALMLAHNIDALVSKNSGGKATEAKLHAARDLAIPVFMIERPLLPEADCQFSELTACVEAVVEFYSSSKAPTTD